MATWEQIRAVVTVSDIGQSEILNNNLVRLELPTSNGRSQLVFIGKIDDDVVFSSLICKLDQVNLDVFFSLDFVHNMKYGVGPVGEFLAVKHVTPLEDLDTGELAHAVAYLAQLGDVLEDAVTGTDSV